MNILNESISTFTNSISVMFTSYVPKFIAGLLIFFIGLIIASLLKDLVRLVFKYFRVEKWLEAGGIVKGRDAEIWPNLLAELTRWTTIFVFLTSAVETWGVPKVGDVLNQLLLFLPNVFMAVVIGLIGLVIGRLASDIVRHSLGRLGEKEGLILGNVAYYAIVFFTALIILTQLGVAAELVKILFTGIVGMLALALGLSFGLGGQDEAREILKKLRKRIEK